MKTKLIDTAVLTAALGLVLGGPAATATVSAEGQRDRANGTVRTVAAQPSPAFVLARKLERDFAQQQAETTGINPYSGRPYRPSVTATQPSAALELGSQAPPDAIDAVRPTDGHPLQQ
jgi:hypothetical protein